MSEPLQKSAVLKFALFNRGTAFTNEERDAYQLHGLLPCHVSLPEEQIKRCRINYEKKQTPLGKYVYLMSLLNRNERLFYQFLLRYQEEIVPYIYTPTVGEASIQFSSLSWHPRGLYLSYPLKEKMKEMLDNAPNEEVEVIVVTDGERILGLGDQGIGGMTISIGKLILYTLFGGIDPAKTLPIMLDVGTNNQTLLENDLYLGWRHKRVSKEEYDSFIDCFIQEVKKKFPKALLQWEDFGRSNARRLLEKYRHKILSFNDDIQGTAGVVLSALLAALSIVKKDLKEEKIVIFGGGSAGIGIAEMIVLALQAKGLSLQEARRRIYLLDLYGLVQEYLDPSQIYETHRPFLKTKKEMAAWDVKDVKKISLLEVIHNLKARILIGVSAQMGSFTQEIVEEMSRVNERPIIFPLSNPTSRSEASAHDLIHWSQGKVILAMGTPFDPVEFQGKTYRIAQCNNAYLFPGIGLGVVAAEAKEISDTMIFEAAETLAKASPALKSPTEPLLPPFEKIREVSRKIAIEVAKKAIEEKLSNIPLSEVETRVASKIWTP